ncbi:MAG: hypothetical protein H3C68_04950 [Deltaproteobacteria bacterium]|nr:hypothetical protein [Deltaproteobacteria bacterium]MBZ0220075.1 hypothetical protein [Deltaproteobacteria bacterium]
MTLFLTTTGVLLPAAGLCADDPRDPYIYRLLYGSVQFDFKHHTSEDKIRTRESDSFKQTYRLDTLGNIYSRYLMTYNAGVRYVTSDTSYSYTADRERDGLGYYLKTSFLPKSTTPLDLSVSRSTNTTSFSEMENEDTITKYTLRWALKRDDLPKTILTASQTESEHNGDSSTASHYRLEMQKALGRTHNSFFYNYTTADNSDSVTGLNFINRTILSRDTTLRFGYARTQTDPRSEGSSEDTTQGITINLRSRPGREFNQSHNYSYYLSETESRKLHGQSYSGAVNYRFSSNLSTNMSLYTSDSVTESATSTLESSALDLNLGANYILSRNVALGQTLTYEYDKLTNGRIRESILTQTSVTYGKNIGWADLSTSYGLGYRENSLDEDRTNTNTELTGLDQNVSASLSNIDLTRFAFFNASASYNNFSDGSGTLSSGHSYSLGASSREWQKYASVSANYFYFTNSSQISFDNRDEERLNINANSSYFKYVDLGLSYEAASLSHEFIEIDNKDEERFKFTADSTYFKNTTLTFSYDFYKITDPVNGTSKTTNTNFGAGHLLTHRRTLMGGDLVLRLGLTRRKNDFYVESETVTALNLSAAYRRRLLRNSEWNAIADRSTTWRNDEFIEVTTITNSINTALRHWTLFFEHRFLIHEENRNERTENTFYLRASRGFFRMLPF